MADAEQRITALSDREYELLAFCQKPQLITTVELGWCAPTWHRLVELGFLKGERADGDFDLPPTHLHTRKLDHLPPAIQERLRRAAP